jgi:hypothetical protein
MFARPTRIPALLIDSSTGEADELRATKGESMKRSLMLISGLAGAFAAQPAAAATVVVYTNPETLERRVVVVDPKGPDRLIMCMLPPGEAGCQQVSPRAVR